MSVSQQHRRPVQLDLFAWTENRGHGVAGNGVPGATTHEEQQAQTAWERNRALTQNLMPKVTDLGNLNRAARRVVANGGAPGVDGMTVTELESWLATNVQTLIRSLMDGSYQPGPVRKVEIPKDGGGVRQLGIPNVIDRLVQQAIAQVLTRILDPVFSNSSFGFRPGRSTHDALARASEYVSEGRAIVVDIDLEKYFDTINHDILMARVARHIGDKTLLRLIRRYLKAGMMEDGVCIARVEGTPQGGPLSPLLANLLLDDLDKELERRKHRFCRYADDCNIYVHSTAAGERVMASVTNFLEKKLKLRVNRTKSAVASVAERKFLGYRIFEDGRLGIAPRSIAKVKEKLRVLTRRRRGKSLRTVIEEINQLTKGWVVYFRMARAKGILTKLDGWIRRRLRSYRIHQCKNPSGMRNFLRSQRLPDKEARQIASSGKGSWRLSKTKQTNKAMNNKWFERQGFESLANRFAALQLWVGTAGVTRPV